MAAAAVCLADAVCGGAAAAATRAVLLAAELLLAAEVAGDACGSRTTDNKQERASERRPQWLLVNLGLLL
jgi:hypothetical protein